MDDVDVHKVYSMIIYFPTCVSQYYLHVVNLVVDFSLQGMDPDAPEEEEDNEPEDGEGDQEDQDLV